jgi:transposase InsO family protein
VEGGTLDDHGPRARRAQHGSVDEAPHDPGRSHLSHRCRKPSQYTSLAYTERIAEVGAAPSIGTVGDSYDNAMAESVMGLFKTELH